ncbi:MAG: Polypeptide-transport-associated domain protein FtsQ-type [Desulfonauticus sp. 38_4375]|nr:MAG: Polypeptide-transport-associated domain protein FtsQ-type [Desulfonauticus sp. 38_4375]
MSVSLAGNRYKKNRKELDIFSFLFTLFLAMILIFLVSFIVLKFYYKVTTMDYFSLKEIEVNGNVMLTYNDINSYLGIKIGDNLFSLNISDLNRKLKENPWIYQSIIKRVLPDKLRIEIKEKEPFFLLKEKDKIFYADIKGDKIDVLNPQKYLSLPVVIKEENYSLEFITMALKEKGFPFSWQSIGGLEVKGEEVKIFIDDYKLWLSLELEGLEQEIAVLHKVLRDLKDKEELSQVKEIRVVNNRAWVSYVQ